MPIRLLALALIVAACGACGGEQWDEAWVDPTGNEAPEDVIATYGNPGGSHCTGWESTVFLNLGWPLGSPINRDDDSNLRQYVRDPKDVFEQTYFRVPLDIDARLPADAHDTGYRLGDIELWVSDRDAEDAIYFVRGEQVERWPRSRPPIGCA